MRLKLVPVIVLTILVSCQKTHDPREVLTLKGDWELFLDFDDEFGLEIGQIQYNDQISLPSSLDEAQKGKKEEVSNSTHQLARNYSFYGKAWYRKEVEIPKNWQDKHIDLLIERTRVTHLWIDNEFAGSNAVISAPQTYNLSKYLTPGKHTITIVVDNGKDCGLPESIGSSHMWTNATQTNWNGMLGEIKLTAKNPIHIETVKTVPDVAKKAVAVSVSIENPGTAVAEMELIISASLFNTGRSHTPEPATVKLDVKPGKHLYHAEYPLSNDAVYWSEFSPALYNLNIELKNINQKKPVDAIETVTALRKFDINDKQFTINGIKTYLRGKNDACVFPLTGYAPMETEQWTAYYEKIKAFGFNHVRFHSWCPPKAAFEAADLCGIYLQPELPFWGSLKNDQGHPVIQFLQAEGRAVLDAFANHPSFVMFATGNEIGGEISAMQYLTNGFRNHDNRPLYALASNYHLGWRGPQLGEDFFVGCRVGGENDDKFEPHIRSSFSFADAIDGGILNATYPNTKMDFSTGVSRSSIPVISHETGQFQMYPDPLELNGYTGVLSPRNLEIFIDRVMQKSGEEKYQKYFDATAALSLVCYKADLEMMRRTKKLAGFQMLDLQDYPGQGTALVGILNSLMESKGIVSEEEFRMYNNDVVPLWIADSYTWTNDKPISGKIQISSYTDKTFENKLVTWTLKNTEGEIVKQGELKSDIPNGKLTEIGNVEIDISGIAEPARLNLEIEIEETEYRNSYPVWVYPGQKNEVETAKDVKLFNRIDSPLLEHLKNGKKAILLPNQNAFPEQTIGGLFTSDYWNYSMFKSISENNNKPVSPGSMGLLINNEHPLFRNFPTENHSNWQWWAPVKHSNPLILNDFIGKINPIVETIDNVERVHFLGFMFECRVGNGKLFVCMSDLTNNRNYRECDQLFRAVTAYVSSEEFEPADQITENELKAMFSHTGENERIQGVKNISYE